ncbi:MAG: hypothetical protein EOO95_11925 [Pedobacter sp.]|nr:MAG: hypothetical protein EOO95_11925 [Pedobacter sp.]
MVIDHWSLVIGHWSLVIGHWSLVIGHWSLVIKVNSIWRSQFSLIFFSLRKTLRTLRLITTKPNE